METYNVKIKDYKEQTVVTLYAQSVMEREKLDNIIIQLKRYRTSISELILDNGDGMGYYACDYAYLDAEIKMSLFDEDLEQFYDYVSSRVKYIYLAHIRTEDEKEERSIITSLSRTKQKLYDLAYCNDWDMFITLTFSDEKLMNKYGKSAWDYDTCVKALHSFFTVLKRKYSEVAYLGVPELHHNYYDTRNGDVVLLNGKWFTDKEYTRLLDKEIRTPFEQELVNNVVNGTYKRRFHFHFLFNNFPHNELKDGGERTDKGQIIYNLLNYDLGFTTCTMIESVSASQFYITKYVTKDLLSVCKWKKRYWASKNLNKPTEQKYRLDIEDKQELALELKTVIPSDARKKRIEIENDGFNNVIHKFIIKDWEVLGNEIIEEYIDIKNKVQLVEVPDYFDDVEKYANIESIFNPFNFFDYGYIRHRGNTYKFNRIMGTIKVSAIYT